MKHLVGKKLLKKVEFMNDKVEVRKLSVSEVLEIQELVKAAAKSKNEESSLSLLRDIIRMSVVGADEISDDDFQTFPLAELNELSEKILAFSGMGAPAAGN